MSRSVGLRPCGLGHQFNFLLPGSAAVEPSRFPANRGVPSLQDFAILRSANLRLLQRASGEDLRRVGVHAERVLSHSERSLIADGHSQSEIRQGVTLAVFGESSMGPLNDQMKKEHRVGP